MLSIARKSLQQQGRDRLGLALTVLMAPLFVVLYWALLDDGARPTVVCIEAGEPLVAEVAAYAGPLEVVPCPRPEAVLVVQVDGLSEIESTSTPVTVEISGDATRPGFAAASLGMTLAVDRYVQRARGVPPATVTAVNGRGSSDQKTPFDIYVPNLLVFAMIMLVFSSAMATAREVERGTLERLRLTRMRPTEYLLGTALAQLVLGAVSIALTLLVAVALGFDAPFIALPLAAVIALFTGLACIGVGTIVASVSRSVAQAFAIASFFMFLLLLFSGAVFPIPELEALELLPTVHGARALHEVLVLDASLSDVVRPLAMLAVLSVLFFAAGGWRFARLHRSFLHGARR